MKYNLRIVSNRVAARYLRGGIFEAPPAMLREIGKWVDQIYASHVLYWTDTQIKEMRDRIGWVEDKITNTQRTQMLIDRSLGTPTAEVELDLDAVSKSQWAYLWGYSTQYFPIEAEVAWLKVDQRFSPHYTITTGVAKRVVETSIVEGKAEMTIKVKRLVQGHIDALEKIVALLKKLGTSQADPSLLVNKILVQRECLKYTNRSRNYMHSEPTKEFPVDLRGWKYGEQHPGNVFTSINVKFDFTGKSRSYRGQWLRLGRVLSLVGNPHVNFTNVGNFNSYLDNLHQTLRHELQHVGQDILQGIIIQDTDNPKAPVPGTSPRRLREPATNYDMMTDLPTDKEHALLEEEFQTRLGDELARFKQLMRHVPRKDRGMALKVWVGAESNRKSPYPPQVETTEFFGKLKSKEPRKWKKAIQTFAGMLSREGVL